MGGLLPWSLLFLALFSAAPNSFFPLPISKTPKEQFLMIWSVFVILFFSISQSKIIGYILPALPPIAILLSGCIVRHWQNQKILIRSSIILGILFLFFSLGLCVFSALYLKKLFISGALDPKIIIFQDIRITLYFLSGLCLLTSILFFYRGKNFSNIAQILIFSTVMFLFVISYTVSKNKSSAVYATTYPLISKIKPYLHSTQKVFLYKIYRQDLPFYLEQKINIVNNWSNYHFQKRDSQLGQLAWAMQFDSQSNTWMLEDSIFWEEWNATEVSSLVFLRTEDINQFNQMSKKKFYPIASYSDLTVISSFDPAKSLI
jgi:TM2 domain-containing membrane protein YozV